MKTRKFIYQSDQRENLYKIGYAKIFSENFVFFVVDYPWKYPVTKFLKVPAHGDEISEISRCEFW